MQADEIVPAQPRLTRDREQGVEVSRMPGVMTSSPTSTR